MGTGLYLKKKTKTKKHSIAYSLKLHCTAMKFHKNLKNLC